MTRPLFEPTQPKVVAKHGWGIHQLYRRPPPGLLPSVVIDSSVTLADSGAEAARVIGEEVDTTGKWRDATMVTASWTLDFDTYLTQTIPGVSVVTNALGVCIALADLGDQPCLWQIQAPHQRLVLQDPAATALTMAYMDVLLFGSDLGGNEQRREQSVMVANPRLQSEAAITQHVNLVGDFLSSDPVVEPNRPIAPVYVTCVIVKRFLIATAFADWTSGDTDAVVAAAEPTETVFYVTQLSQLTPAPAPIPA